MKGEWRKAVVNAYRERKVEAGIYLVRCGATGECWVGAAPDLATIRNRLWFSLRQGVSMPRALQSAWTAHGEQAFSLEVVERLVEEHDDPAYVRDRVRKERVAHWSAELCATPM